MPISQVSSYAPSNNDPTNLMQTTDDMRVGLHELTITEYTTSTVPAIAVGSVIEVNGTLFKAGSETAISGSPSNGTVYVYMVPSGLSPSQVLTPTFTNTAPTWFDSKQGWYDATGTYRYIHYAMTKSGSSYTPKWEMPIKQNTGFKFDSDGTFHAIDYDLNGILGEDISGNKLHVRTHDFSSVTQIMKSSLTNYVAVIALNISSTTATTAIFQTATSIQFYNTLGSYTSCSGTLYYLSSS